jgi:calcium permeable stress-gated cation channel
VLDKLATTLPGARNFFVSYVMLSGSSLSALRRPNRFADHSRIAGLAMMPLQLLELATVIPRAFFKVFYTRTPRGGFLLAAERKRR